MGTDPSMAAAMLVLLLLGAGTAVVARRTGVHLPRIAPATGWSWTLGTALFGLPALVGLFGVMGPFDAVFITLSLTVFILGPAMLLWLPFIMACAYFACHFLMARRSGAVP